MYYLDQTTKERHKYIIDRGSKLAGPINQLSNRCYDDMTCSVFCLVSYVISVFFVFMFFEYVAEMLEMRLNHFTGRLSDFTATFGFKPKFTSKMKSNNSVVCQAG